MLFLVGVLKIPDCLLHLGHTQLPHLVVFRRGPAHAHNILPLEGPRQGQGAMDKTILLWIFWITMLQNQKAVHILQIELPQL